MIGRRRRKEEEPGKRKRNQRKGSGTGENGTKAVVGGHVGESWEIKVKKLALAYETGWEYLPESEEAGSVLTDIFLDMAKGNRKRYEKIWERQELAFLNAAPESGKSMGELSGALLVAVSGEEHGRWLEKGTEAYTLPEHSSPIRFQTLCPVQLTAAKLQYAIYTKGLGAWLSYQSGEGRGTPGLPRTGGAKGKSALALFQAVGEELSHPVFLWVFQGLCDGKGDFGFAVEFRKKECPLPPLSGKWTVSDGEKVFPADWRQTEGGFWLEGSTPDFVGNLEGKSYEIKLELAPEGLTEEWLETLCGGMGLRAAAEEREPDICLTDLGAGKGDRVLPFGGAPDEAACCYLACDSVFAGAGNEIGMHFRESFLWEEKLPQPRPKEYEKYYKKYPWLQTTETVQEWQAEETVWEYFNGKWWCALPDSEAWDTGCRPEAAGEKHYRWKRPEDMKPCPVEGEEHFYIRLRLGKVRNAYAMYYRKAIPVLQEIRFSSKERHRYPITQAVPDLSGAGTEKMYLGFDHEVTPKNRWFVGEGFCCFDRESILGKGVRFGREAFWVELTEKKEKNPVCFVPNYVPIRQIAVDGEEAYGQQLGAGTAFYLEPYDMGMLEAVCPAEIRYDGVRTSVLSERQAAEHYFAHFGRLLTPMDMELMLQERYPLLRVDSCAYSQEDRTLKVKVAYREEELPEIRGWLQKVLSREGPLWLRDCKVEIS